jgi:chaperonin GroES
MSIPITPLADYVAASQEEVKSQTASGLYLPESATEKPKVAKIVAVGKDVKELKVGDRIVYKSYGTTDVTIDKQDYLLIKEEDVLAKVK